MPWLASIWQLVTAACRTRFGSPATERERHRWADGHPRTPIQDDGMARLTLIKGLAPGKQRVIRAETER